MKTLLARGRQDLQGRRSTSGRARFLLRRATLRDIQHPNVVPVLDHGVDAATDIPYIVMPLLEGEDLAARRSALNNVEPDVAVALTVQATDELAAAHARGIIHRDVKPSNLFLETAGTHVVVKVTDFGP